MSVLELGTSITAFFDDPVRSPSHDELDRAFVAAGLSAGDPGPGGADPGGKSVGKVKRLRAVFNHAEQHNAAAGLRLAQRIVDLLRARGAFDSSSPEFAGLSKIQRLRSALDREGYDLDDTGLVRPKVIDNLAGTELTDFLRSYVTRVNANPDDVSLQVGTGKDLDEAAARHVLEQRQGSYPTGRGVNFPYTLLQAFSAVGLATTAPKILDEDPHRAVQKCLYLFAVEVNRLRNDAGTGHGRPSGPRRTNSLSPDEARLVARATALVAGALIDRL